MEFIEFEFVDPIKDTGTSDLIIELMANERHLSSCRHRLRIHFSFNQDLSRLQGLFYQRRNKLIRVCLDLLRFDGFMLLDGVVPNLLSDLRGHLHEITPVIGDGLVIISTDIQSSAGFGSDITSITSSLSPSSSPRVLRSKIGRA